MFLMIAKTENDKFCLELHDDTDKSIIFKNLYDTYGQADIEWEKFYPQYIKIYWNEWAKTFV